MSDPKTLLDNITTDLGKLDEVAKELQKYITG